MLRILQSPLNSTKLPNEKPFREASRIYSNRLGILAAVAILNFAVWGLISIFIVMPDEVRGIAIVLFYMGIVVVVTLIVKPKSPVKFAMMLLAPILVLVLLPFILMLFLLKALLMHEVANG